MRKIKKILLYIACFTLLAGMPLSVNASSTSGTTTTGSTTTTTTDVSTLKTNAIKELTEYMKVIGIPSSNEAKANTLLNEATNNINNVATTADTINKIVDTTESKFDALVTTDTTKDTDTTTSSSDITVGNNWTTPQATYGQSVNIVLPLVNIGNSAITNVIVTPVVNAEVASWPFEIQQTNYEQSISDMPGKDSGLSEYDRRRELTWTFKTRDNVTNGYQALTYNVRYTNADGSNGSSTVTTYVQTVGAPGSGDGSNSGKSSTPRIVITGFSTNPETVKAGDTFVLTLHMKNTSTRTAVNNVQFDIQATVEGKDTDTSYTAFLPTAGSSTIFVDSIGKGQTKDISLEMQAKADLAQKPYQLTVAMQYEDENVNPFTSQSSVSIPVKQQAKLDVSNPEVMPASIEVGAESNIMFSIYNTGKTKLYNVSVKFEGASISGGDAFVGNIDSGATGNVDTMLTGAAATADDGNIKATVTYEDDAGNASTIEKTFSLFVTEPSMDAGENGGMNGEIPGDMGTVDQPKSPLPLIIAIVLILIAAVVITIFVLKRKKKKKASKLQEELDFLENESEYASEYSEKAEKQAEGNEDEIS